MAQLEENPDALGGAARDELDQLESDEYLERYRAKAVHASALKDAAFDYAARDGGMGEALSKYMPDAYKRVARIIGYTLLLGGDADNWHGLTVVLTARLTPQERAAMAWAVLRSLTPDQVVDVAQTVLPKGSSAPIAPLFNHMDEAAFWADMAEPEELDAYCLASFNRMAPARQAAFLGYVQERVAA